MSTFTELIERESHPCKTCRIIEALDRDTAAEVDAAMSSQKYGARRLADALSTVSGERVAETTVDKHRKRGHRR
jgi:hypothetical protein